MASFLVHGGTQKSSVKCFNCVISTRRRADAAWAVLVGGHPWRPLPMPPGAPGALCLCQASVRRWGPPCISAGRPWAGIPQCPAGPPACAWSGRGRSASRLMPRRSPLSPSLALPAPAPGVPRLRPALGLGRRVLLAALGAQAHELLVAVAHERAGQAPLQQHGQRRVLLLLAPPSSPRRSSKLLDLNPPRAPGMKGMLRATSRSSLEVPRRASSRSLYTDPDPREAPLHPPSSGARGVPLAPVPSSSAGEWCTVLEPRRAPGDSGVHPRPVKAALARVAAAAPALAPAPPRGPAAHPQRAPHSSSPSMSRILLRNPKPSSSFPHLRQPPPQASSRALVLRAAPCACRPGSRAPPSTPARLSELPVRGTLYSSASGTEPGAGRGRRRKVRRGSSPLLMRARLCWKPLTSSSSLSMPGAQRRHRRISSSSLHSPPPGGPCPGGAP